MIEVEKKVEITDKFLSHLFDRGELSGEISIHDTYYDTSDYVYTSKNIWLRKRNSAFELKKVVNGPGRMDRYEEITDLERIIQVLNIYTNKFLAAPDIQDSSSYLCIQNHMDFTAALSDAGIHPFASFKTKRRKYTLQGLSVDVDLVDFGEFTYQVAEIECLVEDEGQIERAEEEICCLLSSFDIDPGLTPPGKLSSFLERYCPDHYNVLKTARII